MWAVYVSNILKYICVGYDKQLTHEDLQLCYISLAVNAEEEML